MKRMIALLIVGALLAAGSARAQSTVPIVGSAAAEGSHVYASTALFTVAISWSATSSARFLMIFDGTSLPANGPTTSCSVNKAAGCLRWCGYVPNSTNAKAIQTYDWNVHPIANMYGTVVALSTGADCSMLAVDGNNNFFYAQVQ